MLTWFKSASSEHHGKNLKRARKQESQKAEVGGGRFDIPSRDDAPARVMGGIGGVWFRPLD